MKDWGLKRQCNGGPTAPLVSPELGTALIMHSPQDAGEMTPLTPHHQQPRHPQEQSDSGNQATETDLTDINSLLLDIHKLEGPAAEGIPLRPLASAPCTLPPSPIHYTPESQRREPSYRSNTSDDIDIDIDIEVEPKNRTVQVSITYNIFCH